MSANDNAFEIHVHGDVTLRPGTRLEAIEEALKPLWQYAGARSLAGGAASLYEEEPGIRYDTITRTLQMCWTVEGGEDFRQQLDDLCMNLNDLAEYGAPIEVSFYDVDFDEDDEDEGREARDDFVLLFIGPTPQAIMQVQRDLLVEDVVRLMERHFDSAELGGVVHAIDQLFANRFNDLTSSLDMSRPRGGSGSPGGSGNAGGHGGGRRPRHLH